MNEPNFLDELLLEAEQKEKQLELSHVDMILKEISSLSSSIEKNFSQADEEKKIIEDWAIQRNSKLQDRIDWLSKKLEAFMNEQEQSVRTIDLANGQLLRRKQIEKIVVEDLDQFLLNNNLSDLTTTSPEVVKPDLAKIKAFYKMTKKVPQGCSLVESTRDKFSIKLKQNGELKNGKTKTRIGSEQTDED